MGGCLIGVYQRQALLASLSPRLGLLGLLAGFGLLLAFNPAQQGDELTRWRGAGLSILCFVMVYWAGMLRLTGRTADVARHFGNATYGVYWLHPILFLA